ncbi:hypothetical protein BPNPMPFG_005925 [Mesorhizobium sp. AR07]|uniref:hypothetical protein n=1 Tax=Mesorhizobium sp. AR07 TaxID=2865838 RepID=UPI0021603531|nr:hypothetical protein [Mesorhizobium sp. AR07]UVK44051.1 hypothetical protein BPNPMPFG_005925 [Mesorhizobium sp. AR07]
MQALLASLNIIRQPSIDVDESDEGPVLSAQDWLINRQLGIELGFEARAHLLGEDDFDPYNEPMLLSQVYFYLEHDEVKPYKGPLPFNIGLDEAKNTVRASLAAYESTRRSYLRDTWEMPECRLTVSYVDNGARIGFVLCLMRPPVMPADDADAALVPTIDQIARVMGKPLADPEVRLTFAPLRLDQNLEEDETGSVASFTRHIGIELRFRYPNGGRDQILANVLLYREHEVEGARWPGELPKGLLFNDSPEQVMHKVGRPPDDVLDEEFDGYATWHFVEYSLQVKYSTIENYILCVQLVATSASLAA